MDSYLDTSFLLKLYLMEPHSEAAVDWFHQFRGNIFVSSLSHVEAIVALARDPSTAVGSKNIEDYREDVRSGAFRVLPIDAGVFALADSQAESFSRNHKLRSLDLLHLATALHHGVQIFGTYDDRLGRAATSAGLAVIAPRS